MIRRSPTRIELKLDDIQEFDYVQKYDKKKTTAPTTDNGTNLSAAATAKLLRHDRIGLPRPAGGGSRNGLCLSANCSGTSETIQPSSSASTVASTAIAGGATLTSTPVPGTGNPSEPFEASEVTSGGGTNNETPDQEPE